MHIRKSRSGYVPQIHHTHNKPKICSHMLLLNHGFPYDTIHFSIKLATTVFTLLNISEKKYTRRVMYRIGEHENKNKK